MADVSIRDLRNHGGEVVERAERGEVITVTRSGKPVVELRSLPKVAPAPAVLLDRWRRLPPVDADQLRADTDRLIDPIL